MAKSFYILIRVSFYENTLLSSISRIVPAIYIVSSDFISYQELFGQQACFQNMETVAYRCSSEWLYCKICQSLQENSCREALFEESCLLTAYCFSITSVLLGVLCIFQNIFLQTTSGFVVETCLCLVPTEANLPSKT